MKLPKRIRRLHLLLVAALSIISLGCEKKQTPIAQGTLPPENVAPAPVETTQTILQKPFILKTAATFPFDIPAHSLRPHLHGIFTSSMRNAGGPASEPVNVDCLILNADQYSDFVGNRPSEAFFSVEATHNQSVNVDLPASFEQPMKYYLIFRKPEHGPSAVVQADFHVDF